MAITYAGSVSISVVLDEITSRGISRGVVPKPFIEKLKFATGTTDGKIDLGHYVSETAIAASTTTSYDLAGVLTDPEGTVKTFAETCLIAIRNNRTTALATLQIGPHATNGHGVLASARGYWNAALGAGGGNVVHPNLGWLILYAPDGVPVTGASTDILATITSAVVGSTNAYDLLIFGRSA